MNKSANLKVIWTDGSIIKFDDVDITFSESLYALILTRSSDPGFYAHVRLAEVRYYITKRKMEDPAYDKET